MITHVFFKYLAVPQAVHYRPNMLIRPEWFALPYFEGVI
jgi:hypothetical protein